MKPEQWIVSEDTGVSSVTIWSVMMGVDGRSGIPHDPSDFGRCYRLLEAIPEWKARLPEVAAKFKKWGPMIDAWDELTDLYEEEIQNESGRAPKLYKRMQSLINEGRIADGWVEESPGFWTKANKS